MVTPNPTRDAPPEHIERRAEERLRPDWAQQALADPGTRYVISQGTAHLIQREASTESPAHIAFVSPATIASLGLPDKRLTLLGWFGQRRCVLVDLPESIQFQPPGTAYEELRPLMEL